MPNASRLFSHPIERLENTPPRRLRFWLRGIVVAALLGLISHGHFAGSGDPVHYMTIARSIAFDGDLDVADDYADPGTLIQNGGLAMGAHARPGRGGILRPVHDVGLPLIAAPYFAAAYTVAERLTSLLPERLRRRAKLDGWIMLRQLVSFGMIVVTAWLAGSFFDACLDLTGRRGASWLFALLWTLSPPILSHAYVFFPEIPGALLALLLFSARDRVTRAAPWRALVLGAGAGFMAFLHVRYAILGVAFFVLFAARLGRDGRRQAALWLGFASIAAARVALNLRLWGTWLTTPHAGIGAWTGLREQALEMLRRAAGLCFDQEHGLLLVAPIYALVPAGIWLLSRSRSRTARDIVALSSAYLLPLLIPFVNAHGWRGGWSPAARFLVPIAPLAALPILTVLLESRARAFLAALVALQIFIDAFLWSRPMLQWAEGTGRSPFVLAVGGDPLAAALPSLTRAGALDAFTLLALAILWLLLTLKLAGKPSVIAQGRRP